MTAPERGGSGGQLVGYVRVSTRHQSLDMQLDALDKAGPCHRVFAEKVSGKAESRAERAELDAMLAYVRAGDTVLVYSLSRLGRSLLQVLQTVQGLTARGVALRSLEQDFDTNTATGRLILNMLVSLAEFERDLMHERTAAAREAARDRGMHVGRPRVMDARKVRQARALLAAGDGPREVARALGISDRTLRRYLAAEQVTA